MRTGEIRMEERVEESTKELLMSSTDPIVLVQSIRRILRFFLPRSGSLNPRSERV
jgi:hypothetical protein